MKTMKKKYKISIIMVNKIKQLIKLKNIKNRLKKFLHQIIKKHF